MLTMGKEEEKGAAEGSRGSFGVQMRFPRLSSLCSPCLNPELGAVCAESSPAVLENTGW